MYDYSQQETQLIYTSMGLSQIPELCMRPLVKGYKAIEAEAQCVTYQRCEQSAKLSEIELHHIDADTKADCVSNIVYRYQKVYNQPPAPVTFLLETLKCAPLCHIDHTQLHDAERAGNTTLLAGRFDLIEND